MGNPAQDLKDPRVAEVHAYAEQPHERPAMLCIGGTDSAGLAGLAMDQRAATALDVHCATVVTATTAQDNAGLYAINPVTDNAFESQLDAALGLNPYAIKIGLLASETQIDLLAEHLDGVDIPIVLDPVMATSSAGELLGTKPLRRLQERLLPLCTVITPNLPEAAALVGAASTREQAAALCAAGATWAIVKGGHDSSGSAVTDTCHGPGHVFTLTAPRLNAPNNRGTGCAFASAIAAALARGYAVRDAIVIARMSLQDGLRRGRSVAGQTGCVEPLDFPASDWPQLSVSTGNGASHSRTERSAFPACIGADEPPTLGLYPIVDSADWLARLLPLGITTAQLRNKTLSGDALSAEVKRAIELGRSYGCRLFINDHWALAIEHGAYGVHLGQEDLDSADLAAINDAGLRLGVSSHCHYEVARALTVQPSYLACGPTYATTTKQMPWIPHGLDGLAYWRRAIDGLPLVAIAGINAGNIEAVASTGVSGIALITEITGAQDPQGKATSLMQQIANAHR